ncbi:MAG: YIP1 family protein [Planctomycetota bacterium]|jgi:hypothetical protein
MRCKRCDYPLWNLSPGACPECGNAFRPGDFEFKIGEVRFCCPHCDQAYYGDTADGHLDPKSFECVGCRASIEQDECTVRPLEGQDAIDTTVAPWFDPARGLFKRTIFTAGWAMVRPGDLARGIPRDSGLNAGLAFLMLVNLLSLVVGFLPLIVVVMAVPLWTQGLNGVNAPGIGVAAGFISIFGGTTFAASLFGVLLIAVVAHGILRLTGPVQDGLGRTVSLACFGSGPVLIVAIPCLGPYCGSQVSGVWAIVSTILLLAAGQRVGGGRATLAVLTLPILALLAFVGFVVFSAVGSANVTMNPVVVPRVNGAPPAMTTPIEGSPSVVADGVQDIVRDLLPEISSVSATATLDVTLPERLRADGLGDLIPESSTAITTPGAGWITWYAGDLWLTVIPGMPRRGPSKCVIGIRSDADQSDRITVITISGKDGSIDQVDAAAFRDRLNERLAFLGLGVEDPIPAVLVGRWLAGTSPPADSAGEAPPEAPADGGA